MIIRNPYERANEHNNEYLNMYSSNISLNYTSDLQNCIKPLFKKQKRLNKKVIYLQPELYLKETKTLDNNIDFNWKKIL